VVENFADRPVVVELNRQKIEIAARDWVYPVKVKLNGPAVE